MEWQTVAAILIIFFAAVVVLRQFFRSLRQEKSSCGSCTGCSSSPNDKPLHSIELSKKPNGGKR
jgi:hypothetical protein